MESKVIEAFSAWDLENMYNQWLKDNNVKIVDIKFSNTTTILPTSYSSHPQIKYLYILIITYKL